jgi:hypothetical protein
MEPYTMKYMIGSGYFDNHHAAVPARTMVRAWLASIRRYARPAPQRIVIVTAGGHNPLLLDSDIETIVCNGDLGNLAAGTMHHDFAGWMPPVIITAMIAYNDEMDYFVFQEQDTIAVGPYIEQLRTDMGDGKMVIGRPISGMGMAATQSLFMVRHDYIWKFVRDYLALGPDDNAHNRGEWKFHRMQMANPKDIRVTTLGPERDRPIPWDARVWYIQQPSLAEINEARARGLFT